MARGRIANEAMIKKAAKIGATSAAKRVATKTAAGVAGAGGVAGGAVAGVGGEGLKGLLSYMGKHKLGSAIGVYFLLQMILRAMKGHAGTFMQQGLQRQQIEGQMATSPEDVYYQAMLPQLSQQRQGAQNALLQAVLAGSGQTIPVPGERMIGG